MMVSLVSAADVYAAGAFSLLQELPICPGRDVVVAVTSDIVSPSVMTRRRLRRAGVVCRVILTKPCESSDLEEFKCDSRE